MTEKRLNVDLIEDLFVREELVRLYEENEQLKDALNQRTIQCDKFYQENEQLKQRVKQLEDNIITKLKIIRGDVE